MDSPESSAGEASAHPHPPPTTETRTCASCGGEGYVPLDIDYRHDTGLLTIVGGLCVACRGEGEVTVYLYGASGAGA